jgi:ATP-dependent DNA ligase
LVPGIHKLHGQSPLYSDVSVFASQQPQSLFRPEWPFEVKFDGYRLIVQRDGDRVRCSRNGWDWTKRYPWIVEAYA